MSPHDETNLLSALLDDELEPADQVRVESHLQGCDECRSTLSALRATVEDVRALGAVEPDPTLAWGIQSAVARARKRQGRYARAVIAASGVAAVLVAFALMGGQDSGDQGGAELALAPGVPAVVVTDRDYSRAALQSRLDLDAVAGTAAEGAGGAHRAPAAGAVPAPTEDRVAATYSATAVSEAVARCERETVYKGGASLRPVSYEAARADGVPAFLMTYHAPAERPSRLELWVVARPTCEVLFFAQKPL